MKVYVLIGSHDYEGYSAPEGVYDNLQKAEAAKELLSLKKDFIAYDDIEVMDYTVIS